MYRPYILLKDVDGNPYWRQYGGEPIEDVRKFHEWELEAQRKFKEETRSQEEMDELRNIILSLSIVVGFFDLGDMTNELDEQLVTRVALKWYCKDNQLEYTPATAYKHADDDGVAPYFHLAMFYINSFIETMRSVKANVSQQKVTDILQK